jgi:DNA-directed RNA polymerase specialized sigma24 family protein
MKSLYWLGLLLTADHERAEVCFVRSLENSVDGPPVFKEWAESWSRRTVILNAMELSAPTAAEPVSTARRLASGLPSDDIGIVAVFSLPPFERFAFVMSVLEHYSDQECSLLLGCSRKEVHSARIRALRQIADTLTNLQQTHAKRHG